MYVLGDIHRNINHVKQMIEIKGIENDEIFHVGDFEVGNLENKKEEEFLLGFNEWLKERGIIFYTIRGNHDDPFYFQGNHLYSHLQFLPDYTVIETGNGRRVLCIGGATSIDRVPAKKVNEVNIKYNRPLVYWEDEGFILREDILKKMVGVDVVITHTAPTYCIPVTTGKYPNFMQRFLKEDPNLFTDIETERKKLDRVFELLKDQNYIQYHVYGHFHRYDFTDNGYTQHVVLGKSDFFEIG